MSKESIKNKKIVAICACTAGMAHTYIAKQKIENEAKKRGWDCKVETQGAAGIDNILTEQDLKSADVILLATDISIDNAERLEPFKNVIKVSTGEAVKNTASIFNNAEALSSKKEVKESIGKEIFRSLNTGISKFLPVIIASGILFSIVLMTGHVSGDTILPSNQFFADLQQVAFYGFAMMVPVLAAYMAYSIGGNAALAPAFIMGYVVNNPIGSNHVSTGFIGAMIFGVLIGYFVKWFKTVKVHPVIASVMPVMIIPTVTLLIMAPIYIYGLSYPLDWFVKAMVETLKGMSEVNAAFLGIGIGVLAALDMGGPCSKAATAFTLAAMAEGVYGPNGVFRMCCAIPPLGLAISSLLVSRSKYTKEEKEFGITAFFLSLAGITEGAIPFAAKDPKRVILAIVVGTAVAGMLGMINGIDSLVAFGGLVALGGVTKGAMWYVIDMFIGAFIIAAILHFTRKPAVEDDVVVDAD
ncbi:MULTISPECIES: PTS fructose transporter subunit IIC [Gilliamella]|uniref:PTS fructose transporter subunit IIC n=1 Tax=Gilliamella TaxID=1193503 RepID=UPI000A35A529|nr:MULTISPECIES: fructose-specific PTS transporter subunit EIIC [Gilliamella]MBI0113331.1 PTS fructose transporter subunit IIABC [Gilliamella sp. W8123]MBI0117132.1 PTS fructose transporter subunit IIABC [Gilliamella sp. W8129]OTQ60722.1 PTS fructose transporter subunit IIABC [Gilliamella apis]OTQ65470.1 PTS fructose transporter subunit IIABC [Gilliamella apis]OTQ66622.1 PTS fructose transporter subunit IIABC [Gilliamella apis]